MVGYFKKWNASGILQIHYKKIPSKCLHHVLCVFNQKGQLGKDKKNSCKLSNALRLLQFEGISYSHAFWPQKRAVNRGEGGGPHMDQNS